MSADDRRPILFVSRPESGLLNPMLVLAGELVDRGVPEVWYATDETRREQIEGRGLKFVSLGAGPPELSLSTMDDAAYSRFASRSKFVSHRESLQMVMQPKLMAEEYRRLTAAVDELKPALMVIESASGFAHALAIARKIPFVATLPFLPSHSYASWVPLMAKSHLPKHFPRPNTGLPFPMNPLQKLQNLFFGLRTLAMYMGKKMRPHLTEYVKLQQEAGIRREDTRADGQVTESKFVMAFSVAEVDFPFPRPEGLRLTGAMVPPLPEAPGANPVSEWLDAHDSVVYIGLGTLQRLSRDEVAGIVEVARKLNGRHHVLWNLPKERHELLPPAAELPPNLRVESWLPSQFDVLAHPSVKVFFTHAGSNGFHESLYFGKPMVTRPMFADCHDIARRGESFGLSLTVNRPHLIEPEDIAAKLTRVLTEPSFRQAAERIAAVQQAAGGRERGADLIMELVNGELEPAPQALRSPH
ncbi:glycosyltransferase [Crossiella cryophila]|uniref:Polyene glycosyltransferase n=1 Tax=Crossiella cryophila TaxID=43355 RepID=A0A7W7FVA2_9PSEU|nr:glycosyltransferase [Crossiella cryophila]MBB4680196.1 polyene glycosyltransferase [Crossiella cryophila]